MFTEAKLLLVATAFVLLFAADPALAGEVGTESCTITGCEHPSRD